MRYNPPPNWPPAPEGWQPPAGWQPDPSWGPAPAGWSIWLNDDGTPSGPVYGTASAPYGVPPVAKKKGHAVRNVFLVIVLIIIGGSIAAGVSSNGTTDTPVVTSDDSSPSKAPAKTGTLTNNDKAAKDVAITACTADDLGYMDAKVTITNNSSKTSNYIVTIAFDSPDGKTQLATGTAIVNDLQSGQKSPQDANGLQDANGATFTCRISDVSRYAAG